jgi:hypothetical protein
MEYWACPVMEKSAVARMAAEILNEGISRILFEFTELERIEEIRLNHCKSLLVIYYAVHCWPEPGQQN